MDNSDAKLVAVSAKASKDKIALLELTLEVKDISDLTKVQRELGKVDSVYEIKKK